jgi:hypothetical protein
VYPLDGHLHNLFYTLDWLQTNERRPFPPLSAPFRAIRATVQNKRASRGRFVISPSLLECEAFAGLKDIEMFRRIHNCGYFVEWDNEADFSADTLYLEGISVQH